MTPHRQATVYLTGTDEGLREERPGGPCRSPRRPRRGPPRRSRRRRSSSARRPSAAGGHRPESGVRRARRRARLVPSVQDVGGDVDGWSSVALGAEVPPVQRSLRVRGDTIEATGGEHVRAGLGAGLEVHGLPVPTSPFNLEGGVEGSAEGDDAAMPGEANARGDANASSSTPLRFTPGWGWGSGRDAAIRGDTPGADRGTPTNVNGANVAMDGGANSHGRPRVAHVRGAHVRGGLRRRRRAGLQESAVRRRAARHRGEGDDRSRLRILRRGDAILRREARQARAASPEGRGTKAERLPGRRRRGFKAQGDDGSRIVPRGCGG